jgi:hypothetical protein
MRGLLGHERVTLYTVRRASAILSIGLWLTALQGDITDENFVQSVVEKVTAM